jgi:rhodanese-related sulfurtransferase
MNAREFFAAELAYQTDAADVHAAMQNPDGPGFVLVDSRGEAAWQQEHIAGAVHLPYAEIEKRAPLELDPATPVVTYCWGPGCNAATKAALEFAKLGYEVREMIGGIEYWKRDGLPVEMLPLGAHGV